MKKLFWICLLCLIPGVLVSFRVGGAGILLLDLMLPIFSILWIAHKVLIDRSFPTPYLGITLVPFLLWALFSFIINAWDLDTKATLLSFAYQVRLWGGLIFGWAAFELYRENSEEFWKNLFRILNTVLLFAFLQFFVFPDIGSFSTAGGYDPHIGRLLGTWMDPNFIAGMLAFFLPIAAGKFYHSRKINSPEAIFFLIGLFALLLTFSRSGYLSAVCGLFLFFIIRDPKIILIGIGVTLVGLSSSPRAQERIDDLIGTVAAVILQDTTEIDPTAQLRIESWGNSLRLLEKNPSIGIGYNTYRYKAAEEGIVDENFFSAGGSDSSILTVLVTTGLVGGVFFLFFFLVTWKKLLFLYINNKNSIALGAWAGWAALLVHATFVNSFFMLLIFVPAMAVLGVVHASSKKE